MLGMQKMAFGSISSDDNLGDGKNKDAPYLNKPTSRFRFHLHHLQV